jgi:hypothetical protein
MYACRKTWRKETYFRDLDIDERIILKWKLKKFSLRVWTRFSCRRIGSKVKLFWTEYWFFVLHKWPWISWSADEVKADQVTAFQDRFCSVEVDRFEQWQISKVPNRIFISTPIKILFLEMISQSITTFMLACTSNVLILWLSAIRHGTTLSNDRFCPGALNLDPLGHIWFGKAKCLPAEITWALLWTVTG